MATGADMGSTSMKYPADRDQAQVAQWLDDDMQGGDDFFNNFISYDSADALQPHGGGNWVGVPPSPSMLLDSFDGALPNSSHDQHIPFSQGAAASDFSSLPSPGVFLPSASQPVMDPASMFSNSAVQGNLGQGSNSDSDLLSLGEISLNPTTPSSPPIKTDSKLNSPQKQKFIELMKTPFHKMKNRAKPYKLTGHHPIPPPTMAMKEKEDNSNQGVERGLEETHEQQKMECHGFPPSPPLTLAQQQPSPFVHGVVEDPFSDPLMLQHAISIHQQTSVPEPTPLNTPALSSGKSSFYEQSFNSSNPGLGSYSMSGQHQHAVAMAGDWPMMEDFRPDLWAPGAPMTPQYVMDAGNSHSPSQIWETPTAQMGGLQHVGGPGHNPLNLSASMPHHLGGDGMINDGSHHQGLAPPAPMPSYVPQSELPGLGIHMPQPRRPQAAVLNSRNNNNPNEIPPNATPGAPTTASQQQQQQQHHHHVATPAYQNPLPTHCWPPAIPTQNPPQQHQQPPTSVRRHRPRAPSSGLRHHNQSPRKQPSLPYLREESQSPTPKRGSSGSSSSAVAPHQPTPYASRRSSSVGVRKRRSFQHPGSTGNDPHQHSRRTSSSSTGSGPPLATSSSTTTHTSTRHRTPSTPSSSATPLTVSGSGGVGGEFGFVNFGPGDSKALMTGVAPSGSSKTKARREKEAADRRRRMEEAVRQAGGNPEDIMFGDGMEVCDGVGMIQ